MVHEAVTAAERVLGVDLRFWPDPLACERWESALAAVLGWEPRLQPTHVDRLSDTDAEEPEPWLDSYWEVLARKCASEERFAWLLSRVDAERIGMSVARRGAGVEMSLAVPRPPRDLRSYFLALLEALRGVAPPAIVALFARGSDDAEVMLQGLRGLKDLPPWLYLDARALLRIGGVTRLRDAPCEVVDAPGGLLLVSRSSPWGAPSTQERERVEASKRYMGMSAAHPLVLAEPEGGEGSG
jgi:hypothetical protein